MNQIIGKELIITQFFLIRRTAKHVQKSQRHQIFRDGWNMKIGKSSSR